MPESEKYALTVLYGFGHMSCVYSVWARAKCLALQHKISEKWDCRAPKARYSPHALSSMSVDPVTGAGLDQAVLPNTQWKGIMEGQSVLLTFFKGAPLFHSCMSSLVSAILLPH